MCNAQLKIETFTSIGFNEIKLHVLGNTGIASELRRKVVYLLIIERATLKTWNLIGGTESLATFSAARISNTPGEHSVFETASWCFPDEYLTHFAAKICARAIYSSARN